MIDSVTYLQRYKEGWKDGKFEEKFDYRECIDPPRYREREPGLYEGWFFAYHEMRAKEFKCLSVQGHTTTIKNHIADLVCNSQVALKARLKCLLNSPAVP